MGSEVQKLGRIVIFGTGDIGKLAHFYYKHDSPYEVVAFTANDLHIREHECEGLPVVPFEQVEDKYPPEEYGMFVALSYSKVNTLRAEKYYEAKKKGYRLVSYVCSRLVSWGDLRIGDNCFMLENQTIQPFVQIGDNVTLWSGNHIGHHSVIGDHSFITSHVVVSGYVTVGAYSFLGVNCTIRDGITLAPRSVIGAGAVIMKDTVEDGVYIGPAAKLSPQRSSDIKYFEVKKATS